MAIIKGTNRNEKIIGTSNDDTITGAGGLDRIEGRAGNDKLVGDSGNDTIIGHNYNALAVGVDPVTAILKSTRDNDRLGGGTGDDTLKDYWGNNSLDGGDGHDSLKAGAGIDKLVGGRGNDAMNGGSGADSYIPGAGDDVMYDLNNHWNPDGTYSQAYLPDVADADTFYFEANLGEYGHDIVEGFDSGGQVVDELWFEDRNDPYIIETVLEDGRTQTVFGFNEGSTVTVYSDSELVFNTHYFFV